MIWQQESSLSSYKVVKYEFSGEEPIWLLVCKKTKAYVHSFGSSEHAELLSQVQEKELGVYHPGHLTDENFVAGSQNVIIRDQERTVNVGGVNGQPYKEFKVQFTFHFTLCDLRKRFGLDLAAEYQHPNFGWENRLYEWRDDIKKLVTKQLEKGQHGQFANMAAFVQYTKNAMPARVDLYCLKGVKVHLTVIETTVEKFDGDL
jgi:hypothetical protein